MRRYKKPHGRKAKELRRARVRRIKLLRKIVKLKQLTQDAIIKLNTMKTDNFPIATLTKNIKLDNRKVKIENANFKWDTTNNKPKLTIK